MKTPGTETNQSPEHQMTKLREQARSGGAGGGGRPHFGGTDTSPEPKVEQEARLAEMQAEESSGISLELAPDANDKDMEDLLGILRRSGLSAALAELDRINNPHIEDDFHRLLIQYKRDGHPIPGLTPKHPLARALDISLFEVAIPVSAQGGAGERSLKEVFTAMEQLYLGLIPFVPLPDPIFMKGPRRRRVIHNEHFVLELAVSAESEDAIFYMAIHKSRRESFEKQVLSIFPKARIAEKKDDYNVFNQFGATVVAEGSYQRAAPLPLRLGQTFEYDPMNVTLSAFSKITKEGEGAAIQICVAPAGDYHKSQMRKLYDAIQKGEKPSEAYVKFEFANPRPLWRRFLPELWKGVLEFFEDKSEKKDKEKQSDAIASQAIGEKLKSPIVGVNVRVVASARTKERAQAILEDIEATFGQYEDPNGNRFSFRRPKKEKKRREVLRAFIWRTFDRGFIEGGFPGVLTVKDVSFSPNLMRMNIQELATIYHLTIGGGSSSRELKTSNAKLAPAPTGLPTEGILLGRNRYANILSDIHFSPEDRMRHFYTIGQTGTGKTNFLKQMIIQDIERGEGVCFIDPHGVDVQDILSRIPPERYDDLIYFDPAYTERPMGLNMLEYDPRFPEQKTFVVDEMFQIFKKLYGDTPEAFGPIFEQYFRNATLLVLEDPETGSTLMDISRVLSDEDFRQLKLSRSRNPIVNHFWEEIAEQVRGEGDLRNVVPYITSKFDIFIANEIMRPIIGQQRSAFNFQDVMDNKKILLVNLSKGRLGDVNANLIGLIVVGKILMSALGRSEYLHQNPAPFFLYMDEFQNITTRTIATILSEARKYKLSLTMAHQFIKQLQPSISDAVFGNVGSMAVFRIGSEDAQFLEKQFQPTFSAGDMLHIDNYNAYVKILSRGKPVNPFSMETIAYRSGDYAQIDALKQMSYQRYGKSRGAIEDEIREKYKGMRGVA